MKIYRYIIMLIILIIGFQIISFEYVSAKAIYTHNLTHQPQEHSKEELYQDIIMTLLLPYIQKEVDNYYSKYLKYNPQVAPYSIKVLEAERPNGYRTFIFRLKLLVDPYIGPHNSVGLDVIELTVQIPGEVRINSFKHIKSYKLPPNYEDIIREGYDNPIP